MSFYDGLVPKREELEWEYFDATDDPRARQACAIPDSARDELLAAGFRPLGHAHAAMRVGGTEIISAVWKGEDGRVLASLGIPGASELGTLFEDGTLVKTMQQWTPFHWFSDGAGVLQHWRGTNHFYEVVSGSFATVLARHLERVRSIEKDSPVVVADSMKVHFAMRLRVAELRDARMRTQMIFTVWLTFILSAVFAMGASAVWRASHGRSPFASSLIFVSALVVAMIPFNRVARWWISPWLVRLRRPPPVRDAKTLLEMAAGIPSSLTRKRDRLEATR